MAYFNTSNPLIYNQKDARIGKGNIAPATIDMSKAGYQLIRQFEAFESDAITLADQEYLVVQMKYETKSSIDALLFVNPEIAFFTSGVFIAPGADLLRITPPTLQPNIAPKSNVTTWGVDIGQTGGGVIAHIQTRQDPPDPPRYA